MEFTVQIHGKDKKDSLAVLALTMHVSLHIILFTQLFSLLFIVPLDIYVDNVWGLCNLCIV